MFVDFGAHTHTDARVHTRIILNPSLSQEGIEMRK